MGIRITARKATASVAVAASGILTVTALSVVGAATANAEPAAPASLVTQQAVAPSSGTALERSKPRRQLIVKGKRARGGPVLKIKIKPAARRKITIERRTGGKWQVTKRLKTNKKGRATYHIRARIGTRIRITVKGDKTYAKTRTTGRVVAG